MNRGFLAEIMLFRTVFCIGEGRGGYGGDRGYGGRGGPVGARMGGGGPPRGGGCAVTVMIVVVGEVLALAPIMVS